MLQFNKDIILKTNKIVLSSDFKPKKKRIKWIDNLNQLEDIRTNLIESIAGVMGKVCEYTNPNFEGFLTGELYSPESSNFVDLCNMSDDFMYDYENGVE